MKIFENLSFKTKLIALCLFLSAVSVGISAVCFVSLHGIQSTFSQVTDVVMPKLEEANEMFVSFREVRIQLRTLGLPGISNEQAAEAIQKAKEAIKAYKESNDVYVGYGFKPGQRELYDKMHGAWDDFQKVGERVLDHQARNTPEDRAANLQIFFRDCPDSANRFSEAMTRLLEFHKQMAKMHVDEAKLASSQANTISLGLSVFGLLIGLTIGIIFSGAIAKKITSITTNLADSAGQVSAAAVEIAAASQQLSQSTTEQASSLEETASALEEISSMITKASANADSTAGSSEASQSKAEQGRHAVQQMTDSMEEISRANDEILTQVTHGNDQMIEIVNVIKQIGDKTKVINDIVFQTKLLSFNASVEAARAGEHGKGFAVVAEEVGNLAQMSGKASNEISNMLAASISKVEAIVVETRTNVEKIVAIGKQKVDAGVHTAKECSDVLADIVAQVTQVAALARDISSANREQAQGVGEINKTMANLDQVTQQNASASEEAARSAESLSLQADELKRSVTQLATVIGGRGNTPPPQSSAA
jgi:methyl-accepting chemotaxis protein